MAGKKEMSDALAGLKFSIYVDHKDVTNIDKLVSMVISQKLKLNKAGFYKLVFESSKKSLVDVLDKAT